MKNAILILLILLTNSLNAFSLKERITKGSPGDYVVTEQMGTYTVLLIRSLSDRHLILEEIDMPALNHDPSSTSWKEWIMEEAPGHTAWISYVIDLEKNRLLESYSHSRGAWLYAGDPNNFLPRLLTLSLEKTTLENRKKIGPPPMGGDQDHRALWNPAVIFEGKKIEKSPISVWSTKWPQDDSIISGCEIEIYFAHFSFPYWIEIKSPHYKAAIRTIDSGREMSSPKSIVFQQSPFFIGGHLMKEKSVDFHIHCPSYYSGLTLFAVDLTLETQPLIKISAASPTSGTELHLQVPKQTLDSKLQKGHTYRFALIPANFPEVVIYSETLLSW